VSITLNGSSNTQPGTDPLTTGSGSYSYDPNDSGTSNWTATLSCNGITSSASYTSTSE
jgi:hypothetical protein